MTAGLYIHIPFCKSRCNYCDFATYTLSTVSMELYYNKLLTEIDRQSKKYDGVTFDSIFIGGGTPSYFDLELLKSIVLRIYDKFNITPDAEFSIECNPGTVDKCKLQTYMSLGVNRLSFGLQSCDDKVLVGINRIHDYKRFEDDVLLAKSLGYKNISADLICGLPYSTQDILLTSIDKLHTLNIEHISLYILKLEENTRLFNQVQSGEVILPSEDDVMDCFEASINRLTQYGYDRYEISNFCKDNYKCKHNLKYWQDGDWLGLGLSAASRMGSHSFTNTGIWDEYMQSDSTMLVEDVYLSKNEMAHDALMLGLRLMDGIDIKAYNNAYNTNILSEKAAEIGRLKQEKLVDNKDGKLFVTAKGMNIHNSVLNYLL